MNWIKVEDALPDSIGNYLVYGGDKLHFIGWSFFNSDKEWVDFAKTSFFTKVTHWMPLPERPKDSD